MGNSLSSYFSKQDVEELDQILEHTKQDFVQLFSSVFTSELVVKSLLKESRKSTGKTVENIQASLELKAAPIASEKIMVGQLKKQGGSFKSWKKRYFHAMNKADNYEIVYSIDENGEREKGRISCFGYRLEAFTAEEKFSYGEHGLKLVSNSNTYRRPWLLVAEKETQRKQWEIILSSACRNTMPPFCKNKRVHNAFQQAFHILRRKYGFFGQSLLNDSELGCLHTFFNQVLYQDKLQSLLNTMNKKSNDDGSVAIIVRLINEKVLEVATTTWNHCLQYAEDTAVKSPPSTSKSLSSSSSISSASTTIASVIEAEVSKHQSQSMAFDRDVQKVFEEEFPKNVSSLIEERVYYVIEDLKTRVIVPFLDQSLQPITEAYIKAIIEFHSQLSNTIYEHLEVTLNDENISGLDAAFLLTVELDRVETSIDYYAPGYILKSQYELWAWYTECLAGFADMFESSDNLFLLYCGILDSIRDLIQNALFTFKTSSNYDCDKKKRKRYLHSQMMVALRKLKNDCRTVCKYELLNLVNHLIEITVQESIVVPCADQVNNLDSFSGNFKAFIDVELHTERNILRVVHERVASTLSTYTEKLEKTMDNAYQRLLSENDTDTSNDDI